MNQQNGVKKNLLGATKIEDLAGELKNSTFFPVAPPSLTRFWTPKLLPPNRDEILEWVDEFGCRFIRRNDVS